MLSICHYTRENQTFHLVFKEVQIKQHGVQRGLYPSSPQKQAPPKLVQYDVAILKQLKNHFSLAAFHQQLLSPIIFIYRKVEMKDLSYITLIIDKNKSFHEMF